MIKRESGPEPPPQQRALADAASAGRSITEIAYAAGFSDAAHFSRAFQQRFGTTPRAYRKRHSLAAGAPSMRVAGR